MTEESYTDDADVSQLEQRIDELEETIRQMLPSRREALGMGVAGLAGASLMTGTASAGSAQVGTIGSAGNLVDVEAEDINVSDTLTTQDIVVNGTATGPFGGGGVVLESGDTITLAQESFSTVDQSFITIYNGSAKDVLGGVISGGNNTDFLYEFSDNTTLHKNSTNVNTYQTGSENMARDMSSNEHEIDFLPPALDVIKIEVGSNLPQSSEMGVEVILKD